MKLAKRQIRFEKAGYYFIGLFVLAFSGFWPSYFSHFFDGTANFTFYFHFHVALAVLWIFKYNLDHGNYLLNGLLLYL